MDFRHVCNFFGGTIFSEEYRTDLQHVGEQLRAAASKVTQSSSAVEQASLLLLQGINAAMRGELATAKSYLDDMSRLAEDELDMSWQSRCRHYQFYLLWLKRLPPVLRFRPDQDNDSAIRKHVQLGIVRRTTQLTQYRRFSASLDWSLLEKVESDVILNIKEFANNLWMVAYRTHPNFPRDPLRDLMKNMGINLFDSIEPYPQEILDLTVNLELHEAFGYLRRLAVEYWLGAGLEKASSMLSELYETYRARRDFIGTANCKLLQADNVLSPPFTSPLALNLMPLDQGLGWDNEVWDATEAKSPLRKSEAADAYYKEAFDLFKQGGSKRGQAAVELRRGCVNHAEAVAEGHAGRFTESASLYHLAWLNFSEATRLFQGDSVNLQIVAAHQILLDISLGNHTDVCEKASKVGEWGKDTQNIAVSQYVGLLMLRFGRKLFLASGEAIVEHGKVILCCACARACFKSLSDPLLELQAIVAHALLHQRLGNPTLARAHITEGRNVHPKALQCLDQLAQNTSEGDTRDALHTLHWNRLEEFNRAHRAIFGPGTPAVSTFSSSVQSALAEIQRLVLLSLETVNSDYHQTLKNRHKALIINADVETSERYLREFLTRWGNSAADAVPQEVLASMKLAIFHYLGEFSKARQVLSKAVPVIYGGENSSGHITLQVESTITGGDQLAGQIMLAERSSGQCFLAKDWQFGREVLERIRNVLPSYPDNEISPQHDDAWQLIVWIACIEEHCGHFGQAFDRYLQALHLVETRRQQVVDPDTRRDMLATIHSGELFFGLARISWRFAQAAQLAESRKPQAATWKDQALLYLEQGRARALFDLLITASGIGGEHNKLQEWVAHMYQIRKLDEVLTPSTERKDKIIEELGAELGINKANLTMIQAELEKRSLDIGPIMQGAGFNASTDLLYGCIPEDSICVHINLSRDGMLLLCITSRGVQHVHPTDMTDIAMERTVLRFLGLFRQGKPPATETYMTLLKSISQWIIDPLAHFIREKEHVIFIPSRSFHKFPFSALLLDEKPLFLRKAVSQVPSLSALSYLAQKTQSYDELAAAVVVKSGQTDEDDEEEPLPMAGMEAINIAQIHGCVPQNAGSLANKDFAALYESSDILHIATHGLQSGKSAWQSSVTLQEEFQVLDLAKLRSKAALVVFGACVSGLGEDTIGNDMLGFSHAVIASGASAYLGALWDVNDLASMIMMVFFHRALAERKPDVTLAACWRQAQTKLYEMDTPKQKAVLEELREVWEQAEKNGHVPDDISRQPRDSIEYLIEDIEDEEIDFTHPQYWAPFVLVGHGGLVLHKESAE